MGWLRLLGDGTENRFDFGDPTAEVLDPGGVFQLATLLLNAEIEDLVLHVGAAHGKFSRGLVAEFLNFHREGKCLGV